LWVDQNQGGFAGLSGSQSTINCFELPLGAQPDQYHRHCTSFVAFLAPTAGFLGLPGNAFGGLTQDAIDSEALEADFLTFLFD